jgi:hypothetical protein
LPTPGDTPAPRLTRWYKDAIIYQLHIKAFYDSNDDGIGDFRGLTEKLDYVKDLGVTAIWLLPFYPSPLRDDGYDVADYRNVNPLYGRAATFSISCARRIAATCASSPSSSSTTRRTSIRGSRRHVARRKDRANAIFTSGATIRTNTAARGSSSPIPRSRTGRGTTSRRRITGIASSATSPTSTSTTRRC